MSHGLFGGIGGVIGDVAELLVMLSELLLRVLVLLSRLLEKLSLLLPKPSGLLSGLLVLSSGIQTASIVLNFSRTVHNRGCSLKPIHLWDPLTGQTTATLTHDAVIRSIAVSPNGNLLASASEDGNIQLWNPNTETLQNVLNGHTEKVVSVAFNQDGTLLASASEDDTVRLWDPHSATLQATFRDHTDNVLSVVFSPDGTLLVSASADGTVRVWDPNTYMLQETLTEHTDSVLAVTFNQDGTRFASASADGTVQVWDPNAFTSQATLDHESPVLSIAFSPSPDREILASGSSDGAVRMWDLGIEKVIAKLGHESPVRNVAFSLDGSMLYSTSEDGNMRKWEITPEDTTPEDTQRANVVPGDVVPGDNDTSLVVHINHFHIGFFGSAGFVFQWRQKEPQGNWHEACVVVGKSGEGGKGSTIINNLTPNTTYQVRYRHEFYTCDLYNLFSHRREKSDGWSLLAEGTTSGAPSTDDTSTQQSEPTSATIDAVASISSASVASPAIGEQLELSLNITGSEAIAGYQATVQFDDTALRYVSGTNGDFLPTGAFFAPPVVEGNLVKLYAASLTGEVDGNGTLATLTFEIIAVKTSTLMLSEVLLSNSAGETFAPHVENAEITEPKGTQRRCK